MTYMYDLFATYNGLKLANAVYVVILDHGVFNLSLPRNPERTLHGLASMLDGGSRSAS